MPSVSVFIYNLTMENNFSFSILFCKLGNLFNLDLKKHYLWFSLIVI